MTVVSWPELLFLLLALISLVFYILTLIVLIKNRKVEPLNGHFFKLYVSLGLADMGYALQAYVVVLFRYWGWVDYGPLAYHPTLNRLFRPHAPSYFFSLAQYIGTVAIAANRYCNLVHLNKNLWTDRIQRTVIVAQWLVPCVVIPWKFVADISVRVINNTQVQYVDFEYRSAHMKVFMLSLVVCALICVAVMAVLYIKTYIHVSKVKREGALPPATRTKSNWRW